MSYGDGGTTNDLVVSTSGSSEAQTTFYFDHTDQTWYYTTSTPMVRLNFDPAYWSGVNELNEFNVSIYPNPATDVLNVNNTIIGDELIVYDYLGKVISKSVANSMQQSILIKDFNQGVYLISVIRNGHLINKRFVVK